MKLPCPFRWSSLEITLWLIDRSLIVHTFKDYDDFAPRNSVKQGHLHDPHIPVAEVRSKLDKIRGHLVWFPLDFLKDAEMAEKGIGLNQYTEVSYIKVPLDKTIADICDLEEHLHMSDRCIS